MAVTEYVGPRVSPVFADPAEWTNTKSYEALTVVIHQGNSFTARQDVPQGIDINDSNYWVETGNYNAQIEAYRNDVLKFQNQMSHAGLVFQTYEDMIEYKNYTVGEIIHILGYYSAGDGGESIYVISNTENNYSTKVGSLYANLVVFDSVKPEMFGAYGDDMHDDSTPIQEAINCANGNKQIMFGAKTYVIKKPINVIPNSMINGISQNASIINTNCPNQFAITIGSSYNYNDWKATVKNIKLNNVVPGSESGNCIMLNNSAQFLNCTIMGYDIAVSRTGSYLDMIKFDHCYLAYNNTYQLESDADALYITNCKIESIESQTNQFTFSFNTVMIENCIFNCGLTITNGTMVFQNNHIEGNRKFVFNNSNVTVEGCSGHANKDGGMFIINGDELHTYETVFINNRFYYIPNSWTPYATFQVVNNGSKNVKYINTECSVRPTMKESHFYQLPIEVPTEYDFNAKNIGGKIYTIPFNYWNSNQNLDLLIVPSPSSTKYTGFTSQEFTNVSNGLIFTIPKYLQNGFVHVWAKPTGAENYTMYACVPYVNRTLVFDGKTLNKISEFQTVNENPQLYKELLGDTKTDNTTHHYNFYSAPTTNFASHGDLARRGYHYYYYNGTAWNEIFNN